MALSQDVQIDTRGFAIDDPIVQSGAQIFAGGYTVVGESTHATAAKRGKAFPAADEAATLPMGFAKEGVVGTSVAPLPRGYISTEGRVIENIAVTGLSGDETDHYQLVYVTADDTFSLTAGSNLTTPVGFVVAYRSTTRCDFFAFSFASMVLAVWAKAP